MFDVSRSIRLAREGPCRSHRAASERQFHFEDIQKKRAAEKRSVGCNRVMQPQESSALVGLAAAEVTTGVARSLIAEWR